MANTGYRQATIAYKVSRPGGEPLDINGDLISVSGRKQAIALLRGVSNPDPSKYEVEFYFREDDVVSGNSTIVYDNTACPNGFISVSPSRLQLTPDVPTGYVTLQSSHNWELTNVLSIATVDYQAGAAGNYLLSITRTGEIGGGYLEFTNGVTNQKEALYILSVDSLEWILEDGIWNGVGVWATDGIWKTI